MKHTLLFFSVLVVPFQIFSAQERPAKRNCTDAAVAAAARVKAHFKKIDSKCTETDVVVHTLAYNPATGDLGFTLSNGKAYVKGGKKSKKTPCYYNKNGLPLTWSPDGTQLALPASTDIKIWNPTTDTKRWLFGHTSGITDLCWKNSKLIATSKNGTIKVWDPESDECTLTCEGHTGSANCVDATDDVIVSGGDDSCVKVWNLKTGKCVKELQSGNQWQITCVACHPIKPLVAAGSCSRPIELWNLITGAYTTLSGHLGGINGLAWDRDGKFIASASNDGTVRVWDPTEKVPCLQSFRQETEYPITAITWSPADGTLVAGSHKKICFYKEEKDKE